LKTEARQTGGAEDFPALEFQDVSESVLGDFNKFADAAAAFAARNAQLGASRIADVAIAGMISASPDCHTYYVNAQGSGFLSRPVRSTGTGALVPSGGTSLGGPDQAGLTGKMLPGGIAYITWRDFISQSNYKIGDTVRAILDKAVASGARAWLFDLRGNGGGVGSGEGPGFGPGHGGGTGGGAFRVGGGVSAPKAIYSPDPEYSEEARKVKHMGTVVLWLVVGPDGKPRDIKVLRTLGLGLDEKAIEAVKNWRFDPAKKDGKPVAVQINVEVNFHLY